MSYNCHWFVNGAIWKQKKKKGGDYEPQFHGVCREAVNSVHFDVL